MDVDGATTPITVFTGFLGSGKTTCIISLIRQIAAVLPDYRIALLKNEYGDVKVDSELARASNIAGVEEMLNGCLCCTLTGVMHDAIIELKEKYRCDRILVETSGTAFPAPIALHIREMTAAGLKFHLDSIVTVIDCENFSGYEDTSYTAKLQAQFTDVILLNKHEHVSERACDDVLDHIYLLNPDTPVVKTFLEPDKCVNPDLVFGLDTKQFQSGQAVIADRGHSDAEVDILQITGSSEHSVDRASLAAFLDGLPRDEIYRIKGWTRIGPQLVILNYAFGRWTLTPVSDQQHQQQQQRLDQHSIRWTVMLEPGTKRSWQGKLAERLSRAGLPYTSVT